MPVPRHPRESYGVGIICALAVEKAAVEATLDEEHGVVKTIPGDDNAYTFGRVGVHHVVIACMPAGVMGKASAAAAAKDMTRSFPIKVGLMVGICGGVWSEKADVRLGDVVVSQPDGMHGGVVQWDFGKMEKEGVFRRTGSLDKPPRPLLNAIQNLKAKHQRRGNGLHIHLADMLSKYPNMANSYRHPGREHDELFEAAYSHLGGDTCDGCDRSRLVQDRPDRGDDAQPQIHYGNIASGDGVMRDAPTRDRIARQEGILCFEMEAAGLMDAFPCVVIRGVCDYADSHKNKRWQAYAAATAACYAKELLGVVEPQGIAELKPANRGKYLVPFSLRGLPLVNYYVEREEEMKQLTTFFQQASSPARRKTFVVHGLGGMGKTQLCAAFARAQQDEFTAIFWLDGSSKDALRQSLSNAALRLPTSTHPMGQNELLATSDVQKSIDLFFRWLSEAENTRWLLVLDNVDRDWQAVPKDPQAYQIEDFLPTADHGNVLITTRLRRLQRAAVTLHMGTVDDIVARKVLELRADMQIENLEKLLDRLGGLPLALVQAGAYLRETNVSVEQYLGWYDQTWSRLMELQNQFPLQEYAERSVLTTWKMSYEQVSVKDKNATRLLDLWAFLHPGDMWDKLAVLSTSTDTSQSRSSKVLPVMTDDLSFRHSVGILSHYSLVTANMDGTSFSIHPVVHAWCLHNIALADVRQQLCRRALLMVAEMIPTSDSIQGLQIQRRLLPHAKVATGRHLDLSEQDMPNTLAKIADFWSDWEVSDDVERTYLSALKVQEMELGPEHKSTLETLNNLGILYQRQDKLAEAEKTYMRALQGYEKSIGSEHIAILDSLSNLGILYWQQGRLSEAENMYRRALKGKEQACGWEDPSTLNTVNNLGLLYIDQGKLADAEAMCKRALQGFEKTRDLEHPLTLSVVNNLALLYSQQGKKAEAEDMYRRALNGFHQTLGSEHALTLQTIDNLASLYMKRGELVAAEDMYKRALKGKKKALGSDHTSTLETGSNLCKLYRRQGKLEEAEEMYPMYRRYHETRGEDPLEVEHA